jgi:hypothetical protein
MQIYLKSIRRGAEATAFDFDGTYLLVFSTQVDAKSAANTVLYGPWGERGAGRFPCCPMLFYGPGGLPLAAPENILNPGGRRSTPPDPEDVIIIAALMETDGGDPRAVKKYLHACMKAALAAAPDGIARTELAGRLLRTMREALRGPITIGILDNEDLIDVGEVSIRNALQARLPTVVSRPMTGEKGRYELFFEIAP